ncbi:uncharacterized protein PG998_010114 [Apiospora kogelbergensis]|uniref:uncharacterized protein n=1 Tax=Apiospora kogelbergensis TaxID=1337665 RepID=UPI00312CC941
MQQARTFDVIIVGGGTAGCVLAARLSACDSLQVLLLEAGSDKNNDPKVLTPLTSRRMFNDPEYDWCYTSTPQQGLNGRNVENTRGRMLGGSSAINSHSLVYPNRAMHDAWASIAGDSCWSWNHIQPYYRKFQSDPELEGSDGPIQASYPAHMHIMQKAWEDVFDSLDARSPKHGERSFAGNTYLATATRRSNLVVETNALVHKLVFKKADNVEGAKLQATGVYYEKAGQMILAQASNEVVLCAGAFGSPQILELSGIGSHVILEEAGVDCLLDLPRVGENLQDHLNYGPSVEILPDIETMDVARRDAKAAAAQREEYDQHKTGPLSEGAAYSFAYWPLQLFNTPGENDALHDLVKGLGRPADELTQEQYDFVCRMLTEKSEATATVFMTRIQRHTTLKDLADGNYMTVVAMLAHPLSRGSVHIHSANPHEQPRIDNGYLTHPLDAEILAKHALQIETLLDQDIYASILRPNGNRLPRDFSQRLRSEEEAKEAIRKYGATNYHPCGTCVMARDGMGGVVDGQLKVHGTVNLRVCYASIFPIIPRGNILSTVYAVAELGADIILRNLTKAK